MDPNFVDHILPISPPKKWLLVESLFLLFNHQQFQDFEPPGGCNFSPKPWQKSVIPMSNPLVNHHPICSTLCNFQMYQIVWMRKIIFDLLSVETFISRPNKTCADPTAAIPKSGIVVIHPHEPAL